MNKKLMLGIHRNRRFLGHIKSFLILSCVFLVLASFVFADIQEYTYTLEDYEIDSFDVSGIDNDDSLINWRCDFRTAPSVVFIGDCYCIDTKGGFSSLDFSNQADGIGYGNLFECLKFDDTAQVKTSATGWESMDLKITANTDDTVLNPSNVNIERVANSGGTVKCNHDEAAPLQIYTFYREKPFTIMEKGLSDELILPSYITTGDSIKCQVAFYQGWENLGSATSENSLVIDDTNVVITSTYLAPANPKANDVLYCYGNSLYDVNDTLYQVNHTFEFYKNNILVSTTSYLDSDGLANPFYANYSDFVKGDSLYCNYTINVLNSTSEIVNDVTWITDSATIINSRPSIPNILITIKEAIFG